MDVAAILMVQSCYFALRKLRGGVWWFVLAKRTLTAGRFQIVHRLELKIKMFSATRSLPKHEATFVVLFTVFCSLHSLAQSPT